MGQFLNLGLPNKGFLSGGYRFAIHQRHRTFHTGVSGSGRVDAIVFFNSAFYVSGASCIERVVAAADNVNKPHI